MKISPENKKVIKDLLLILIMIAAYIWKGVPLLASFIVGWIIIRRFSRTTTQEDEN